jgi:FKBP-type peptidyl-prolyl cis-trans isomerase FklB
MERCVKVLSALIFAAAVSAGSLAYAQAPAAALAPAASSDAANAAFLATNAKLPGVVTLPSGLQYKVVTAGAKDGASPKEGDVIKVHYEGKLISGEVFDSSFARNKPALMPLDGLVPAWMEAVPRMHVGDEWVIYAPPELGYGPEGAGPIPPNSILVFRMKLLGFLSAD